MRRAAIALVALVACKAAPSAPRDAAPSEAPVDAASPTSRATELEVEPFRRRAVVPAIAYAAVTRDAEVLLGAVGAADVARGVAASADTPFEAASIAKTIIATCVMQLVDEGRAELDADVGALVGFPVANPRHPGPITLAHLLTHTSSIVDREAELRARAEDAPLGAFLERYLAPGGRPRAGAFADAAPGAKVAYSNVGAALAAFAVERAAGVPFREHAARRIFAPLGMRGAAWSGRDGALPHASTDGGFAALPPPSHAVYPVVDLRASARNLARFARAILRGGELDGTRILSPRGVHVMLQAPHAAPDQALGWQVRVLGGASVVGHEGEDRGASTALFLDREAAVGAVVLANGDAFQSDDPARSAAIGDLVVALLGVARASAR